MKRYILLIIFAAAMVSCSDEITMTPALSFFSETPEVKEDTAIFRLATAFMPDSTERVIPVRFGGTAEFGTDYTASAEAFIYGGDSPVDSIVITTLKFGTDKTVSLTLDVPDGLEGGKFITSEFTIQNNPAYISFTRKFGILADYMTVSFQITDRTGIKKPLPMDIDLSLVRNPDKSTATEGTDFSFADSSHFTIKAGEYSGELKIARPDGLPAEGKDRLFFTIAHDERYGDGKIPEMEINLMEKKWSKLDGNWDIDTLVTDSTYMKAIWGEGYTGYDLLPKYNMFDEIGFNLDESTFTPSFYSSLDRFFLGESDFTSGPLLDTSEGMPEKVHTFLLNNTNRYFSSESRSEDTESYIGLSMTEGEPDTLSVYILDHTSRSFLPELEAEGKYAPEKPVAASPGLFIKAIFTKQQ